MKDRKKFLHFKRRIGDRYDGWRVNKLDTVFRVIPYFLRTRIDAQNFFEDRVEIDHIEAFIREHKEDMPNLSLMHIVIAGLVRLVSQRPALNRFVVWNKIFARNHFSVSLIVKRTLADDGEETLIKPYFQLEDTLPDVVRKIQQEIDANQPVGKKNDTDNVARFIGLLPDILLRFVVFMLMWMDKVGMMPKLIYRVSPWHCSMFITNIGSIGVESIYHHLYEFGTCSMFVAMGKKTRQNTINKEGEAESKKSVLLRFVMDERVCDGYYYANSMRQLNKILSDPAKLLLPPEKIVVDSGIGRPRADLKKEK
jgi:hypothetical protein